MSASRASQRSVSWKLIAKLLLLPFIACAVVGAESLTRTVNFAPNLQEDEKGLNETFRSHFIQLDSNNTFRGLVTGIDANSGKTTGVAGLKVYLVQKSKVIQRAETDNEGRFSVAGVNAGTYSFCVAGKNGFLAYGVHLLDAKEDAPSADPEDGTQVDESMEIHTRWIAPTNVTAAVVPPEFKALRQIMSDLLPGAINNAVGVGSENVRINVEESIVAGGYKINLDQDGTMKGRVAPIGNEKDKPIRLREMNAFLIVDDEVYARATVQEDGTFEFKDVEPGVYGFAAAGKDGFAAISFQAVEAESAEDKDTNEDSEFVFASAGKLRSANFLSIAICPPEDSAFLKRTIEQLDDDVDPVDAPEVPELPTPGTGPAPGPGPDFVPPFNGGGFDSPAFSGGGGFGGRPGLNRLFRLGALGGIIFAAIELADDDDDDNLVTPNPTSPSG